MSDVTFTKPATYAGRKEIEATLGEYPDCKHALIKEDWPRSNRYDVQIPGHSSTRLHGETVTTLGVQIAQGCTLREAKQLATEYLRESTDER